MTVEKPAVLRLLSPFTGVTCPLAQVPDPAFAQKMVGDGFAVDPTDNVLVAPCDATVTQIHPSRHAVTLTTEQGIELLIHIGVDTVKLRGEGFKALVQEGEKVSAKTPLVEVDMDPVAQGVKSLRTVVLLTDQDRIASLTATDADFVQAGDLLFKAELKGVTEIAVDAAEMMASEPVTVINPTGIHARPAAAIVAIAKQFGSAMMVEKEGKQVNARSVVALMGLNIGFGDQVKVLAHGDDAEAALAALVEGLKAGLGEEGADPSAVVKPVADNSFDIHAEPSLLIQTSNDERKVLGIEASAGQAKGTLYVIASELPPVAQQGGETNEEKAALDSAIAAANQTLADFILALRNKGMGQKADIFVAHQELLEDPDVYDNAVRMIQDGKSAGYAWRTAVETQADTLSHMDNALLAGRAADLRDVGGRVARVLAGLSQETIPTDLPENTILVAKDLTPSDTANLDPNRVLAIATVLGGASSHSAILARAMGIAAMAGVEERVLSLHGQAALMDTAKGYLLLNPSEAELAELALQQQRQAEVKAAADAAKDEQAFTEDGVQVEVAGNIAKVADAEKLVAKGGEAVGLLRSEFLYESSQVFPSEADQEQAIRQVLTTLGERPLIVRTLDVGGDKPLPYLPLPEEENPFLGERGIRVGLDKPAVLRQQLRALLKAAEAGRLRIMFPMIASLFELNLAKQILNEEAQKLGIDMSNIEVGIMIEVPSAAVMADLLAEHVDFFSIGTNDLTQYTLAIDRGHPKLAGIADGLHPAVLRLIQMTADAAHRAGKWVGVCGGLAGEKDAVPLLVGLGIDELSCSVPVIPEVKHQVRGLSKTQCVELAGKAMMCADAKQVRELMKAFHADHDANSHCA
ncbi:phosphoenolpyruvate--protein phosphotransferase [Ferrimonas marina]|uniref:phosphoenolpyruvate--protein phosphotransferase n=1 Tax=Ferrimonas marina TaxID=299255 RepID=A0A1M5YBJ8_9GAMM|nr:phosphoenolpyruvate--protein phosphotransferase [Ferrimonas marina]SHI09289.1 phosphocarrier protein FPr [Ferrimonas marina]